MARKVNNLFKYKIIITLYKILPLKVFFLLIVLRCSGQFSDDTIILIKKSPFFEGLINKHTSQSPVYSGEIKSYAFTNEGKPFIHAGEFLSLPDFGFFFHVYNTGRLYKLEVSTFKDSSFLFKRIDNTVNKYYNIGSYLFSYHNQIFDFGGYGFWKNNGLLRKFNVKDKEWDVIELDKEVFPPNLISDGHVTWLDSATGYLFVPFQEIRNDGLTMRNEDDDIDFGSHRLNLKTRKWEYLGNLDEQAYQTMKFAGHIIQSEKGLLLVYINRVYWVDFLHNQIKVAFDPTLGQTLHRIQRSMLLYWSGEQVYWYNSVSGLYDSAKIELSRFNYEGQTIWKKSLFSKELIFLAVLFIGLAIFFLFQFRRSKNQVSVNSEFTESQPLFSETELALLSLLLSKHKINKTAAIPEINYVLGLKDKNHGMQKKVRSEIINRINEKYILISKGKDLLIQNIRSDSDKRFFEYLVNPALVAPLRKLMDQSL